MLYININKSISRWSEEDLIYSSLYSYDQERISKGQIEKLCDHYCKKIAYSEFVSVDELTDWIHELTDEEIEKLTK